MDKVRAKIRYIFWGAICGAFILFFVKDLNPSGVLSVSYNLCAPSPYISELSPHGRVLDIEKNTRTGRDQPVRSSEKYCAQRMVIDPVYVDVRLPQRYDKVTMALVYQKSDDQEVRAGPWASTHEWQWELESLEDIDTQQGWRMAMAQFNITDNPMARRRLRFMISAPGLDTRGEEIIIRKLQFTFEKPSFGPAALRRWASSFL